MRPFSICFLGMLIASAIQADTIRLRDGKEYEGVVVSDEGDELVIMVKVTKTISDQRRIPKSEIIEIIVEKKDETAFEALKGLMPTPELLKLDEYDTRLGKFEGFLREFPDSDLVEEVASMHDELDAEREIIAAGGVKFDGRLISPTERQAVAFTLDSQIAASAMHDAIEARKRIDALRAWDHLQEEFPNSRAYLDAVEKILPVMRAQLAAVSRELETIDSRIEERLKNLERVPEKDRARAEAAIRDRATDFARTIEKEREDGIRWTSLDPFEEDALKKAKTLLTSEIRRLENFDSSRVPDGDAAWADAWEILNGSPTPEEAREALKKAKSAKLPETYLEMLESKAPSK